MPGITGFITRGNEHDNSARFIRMLDGMAMEDFYTKGSYKNFDLGLYIGWTSIKNSFSDCMPVWNEMRNLCIIFSGENYADKNLLDDLKIKGHEFDSSNASYLIHLYEEYAEDALLKFNGRYHGVLVDTLQGKIILFNDRYAMQRIYYHENKDAIYFSSEAKSLLKILPELRVLNMKSFGEYFSCGCTLQNRSLFKGIYMFPCGSAWTFRHGKIHNKKKYFKPEDWESQAILRSDVVYDEIKNTFMKILPRYVNRDINISMSLTGGLDTRMIMAALNFPYDNLPCVTFGGLFRECYDVKIAREVAKLCSQTHEVITVGQDFLQKFPNLAERTVYITDGAMDVSGSPDLYVNKHLREISETRMTGNYGDEVIRSVRSFKPNPPDFGIFKKDFYPFVTDALNTYNEMNKGNSLSVTIFKQIPWHHFGRYALEQSQINQRTPFLDNDLVKVLYQMSDEDKKNKEFTYRIIRDGNKELSTILTDRGVEINSKSMRSKFINIYREFLFKAEYAYDYGMPHWVSEIDRMLIPFHPERLFLGRHKFHHFRVWYRDQLSGYIKNILLDKRTMERPYFDAKFIENMVNSHVKGEKNYTMEIHKALTAELIQRVIVEEN